MAETQYSLNGAQVNRIEPPQLGRADETSGTVGFTDPLSGLNLALTTASLDVRLLVLEQVKLRETLALLNIALSAQQSLCKANASAAASSGSKSKLKAEVEQSTPPDRRKSSMALELAMVELNLVANLGKDQLAGMAIANLKMASEKQVALSGATAVQLAQVELAAAKAGIGNDLEPAKKQDELLAFTRDSAVTASAFNLDVKAASEMLLGWRTAMGLDRGQRLSLADATNHLGNSGLNVTTADIGSVVQRGGEVGIAAGMTPEQVAALAAAFLNSGVDKAGAEDALKGFTSALAKGNAASPQDRKAWAELDAGLNPAMVADGLRTDAPGTINLVLEALKKKPVEEQQSLTQVLFGDNTAILELLKKPQDTQKAFALVSERTPDGALPKYDGSVAKTAETLGGTSQGRWNAHDASQTRLSSAVGNALMPLNDGLTASLDTVTGGLSSLAEDSPKAAAGIALLFAAVGSLVALVGNAVLTEALSRVSKKTLNQATARLPESVGDALADGDEDIRKGKSKRRKSRATRTGSPGVARRLMGGAARIEPLVSKAAAPLMVLSAGYDAYKGLRDGDDKAVGGAVGEIAGTVVGATIGSFILPGIGTAIGGFVGGMAGSWLGEQLVTPADRLNAPGEVTKGLSSTQTATQQNTMTANIYINGQDQASASQLANLVAQQLSAQFALTTMPNSLAMRSDAALTDGGT
ncbi:phage tail tape measure protein [Pseudomonas sp. SWRI196]|uniref:Phage tail tape measure protein n=1 Tax=Pseudomonas tehranensis TaxID=2745502 RepID=A0ABR6UW71_9PSED|nr:phage tail tape measure protein [Pseudomonas tehranensis]MBC3348697.1 phage tail tape measure protein [Pseudomonas tehranensis]